MSLEKSESTMGTSIEHLNRAKAALASNKARDALGSVEKALSLSAHDPDAVAILEELLPIGETRARAAAHLDRIYGETNSFAKQSAVVRVLVATAASKDDRIRLYQRLAEIHEKLGAHFAAFDVLVSAAAEFPRELELWDRLAVFAARTQRTTEFVAALAAQVTPEGAAHLPAPVMLDLAERLATLLKERLGDLDRALPYFKLLLQHDPQNDRAFSQTKQILTALERWPELCGTYEQVLARETNDARRAELYGEVGLIAEEIVQDRPRAIRYFEEMKKAAPDDDVAWASLERLYRLEERWEKSAEIAAERPNSKRDPSSMMRAATMLVDRAGKPAEAVPWLEELAGREPNNVDVVRMLEQTLALNVEVVRVARALEDVYRHRNSHVDLVRVMERRLAVTTEAPQRAEILRVVSSVRDQYIPDPQMALRAYLELITASPSDYSNARERVFALGEHIGLLSSVLDHVERHADGIEAPKERAAAFADVARARDRLGMAGASAWQRAANQRAGEPALRLEIAGALERAASTRHDDVALASALEDVVEFEMDNDLRIGKRRQLGALYQRMGRLEDAARVLAPLVDDPEASVETLETLAQIHHQRGDYAARLTTLRARADAASGTDLRGRAQLDLADALAARTDTEEEAIEMYRTLAEEPELARDTYAKLLKILEQRGEFDRVADVLDGWISSADDDSLRTTLLVRMAQLKHDKLGDTDAALELCRQVLSLDPSHEGARAQVTGWLSDASWALAAANILKPLYEGEGNTGELLSVYDVEVDLQTSPEDRLPLIREAYELSATSEEFSGRAFDYARKAALDAVHHTDLEEWLSAVVSRGSTLGRVADVASTLETLLRALADAPDKRLAVQFRVHDILAEMYLSPLNDPAKEGTHLEAAIAMHAEAEAPVPIDSLRSRLSSAYQRQGRDTDLAAMLSLRIAEVEDIHVRRGLLGKLAALNADRLNDLGAAARAYERSLDLEFDSTVAQELVSVYRRQRAFDALAKHYERWLGATANAAERPALHMALARVLAEELSDPVRAVAEYEAALSIGARHDDLVPPLERLLLLPSVTERAALALEGIYAARGDFAGVARMLATRLSLASDGPEWFELAWKLATVVGEEEDDSARAMQVVRDIFLRDPHDLRARTELDRLGEKTQDRRMLVSAYASAADKLGKNDLASSDLYYRAGRLSEDAGDLKGARDHYRASYETDPAPTGVAYVALDRVLDRLGDRAARISLGRASADQLDDVTARVNRLLSVAEMEKAAVRTDDAVTTYRAVLASEPRHVIAFNELCRLLVELDRPSDLSSALTARAEAAETEPEQAHHRLRLAVHLLDTVGEAAKGIEELGRVLELKPMTTDRQTAEERLWEASKEKEHAERALTLLEGAYKNSGDWERQLVALERLTVVERPLAARVATLRALGHVLETKKQDRIAALGRFSEAYLLDPEESESRDELDRIATALTAWDVLAKAYGTAIEKLEGVAKRELIEALARLHDKRRDDPRRALDAWMRALAFDDTDPLVLDEVEELATLVSDWRALERVFTKRTEVLVADDDKARVWRQAAEVRRDSLDDRAGARQAFEKALELEAGDTYSMDALLDLYEAEADSKALVALATRRLETFASSDAPQKSELLTRTAVHYEKIGDRRQSISLLSDALELTPGAESVLRVLARLYEAEEMWVDLHENLEAQLAAASAPADRAHILLQLARVRSRRLERWDEAVVAYQASLEASFDSAVAQEFLDLGESRPSARLEVCGALEPLARKQGAHHSLARLLELRGATTGTPEAQAASFRELATVRERDLGDPRGAFDASRDVVRLIPMDLAAREEAHRLAKSVSAGALGTLRDLLLDLVSQREDHGEKADLLSLAGRIAWEDLKSAGDAVDAWERERVLRGDFWDLLVRMEAPVRVLGDRSRLVALLGRMVDAAQTPRDRADVLLRFARLRLEVNEEARDALALALRAETADPTADGIDEILTKLMDIPSTFNDAASALGRRYLAAKNREGVAQLFERRVEAAPDADQRAELGLEYAHTLESAFNSPDDAQRVVEKALTERRRIRNVFDALSRLLVATSDYTSAADAAVAVLQDTSGDVAATDRVDGLLRAAQWYAASGATPKRRDALELVLNFDGTNVRALRDLTQVYGELGDQPKRLTIAFALAERLGDEEARVPWELVFELATAENDATKLEAALRWLTDRSPNDIRWLDALAKVLFARGENVEGFTLIEREARLELDAARKRRLLGEAATGFRGADRVKDAERILRELFFAQPTDEEVRERLLEVLDKAGSTAEMVTVLETALHAKTGDAKRPLRLRLAQMLANRMDRASDAADVLRDVALSGEASAHEHGLYEDLLGRTDRWSALVQYLEARSVHPQVSGDANAVRGIQKRRAQIFSDRIGDFGSALEVYLKLVADDPTDIESVQTVVKLARRDGRGLVLRDGLWRLVDASVGDVRAQLDEIVTLGEHLSDRVDVERALVRLREKFGEDAEVHARLRRHYEAASEWSKLADAWKYEADIREKTGRADLAVAALKFAADLAENRLDAPEEAVRLYERAGALAPMDRDVLSKLAEAYARAGKESAAADVLDRVVKSYGGKRSKEVAATEHQLGSLLRKMGRGPAALIHLDSAFKMDPANVGMLRDLAMCAFELDDLERAERSFRSLLLQKLDATTGINKGQVFQYLGHISRKKNDLPRAINMYERAVENDASLDAARQGLAELKAK